MSGILSRFRIEALHNSYTIDVPIRDNKLILIGENGTGKSTFTNFIYFFLTNQWQRMLSYDFKSVLAEINGEEISFTRSELLEGTEKRTLKRMPLSTKSSLSVEILAAHLSEVLEVLLDNREDITHFLADTEYPSSIIIEALDRLTDEPLHLSEKLALATRNLQNAITDRILYLPTYRRIEQDLRSISPELNSNSSFKDSMERWRKRAQKLKYVELVQFGMQDVIETVDRKMKELKDNLSGELKKLTVTYLSDVIQERYQAAKPEEISQLDEGIITAIFDRLDESVLLAPEQEKLRAMVDKIRAKRNIKENDYAVLHFLTKLIALYKNQEEKEEDVRKFVAVCNKYLVGKEFTYDNINFEVHINLKQNDDRLTSRKDDARKKLTMDMLSSGEKQIVSLFSQIYLANPSSYFVIIDEPELSLSYVWQQWFLPDIIASKRCSGLIAVTHSPSIVDNNLDQYVRSIQTLTKTEIVE